MKIFKLIFTLLFAATPALAANHYLSPTGTDNGTGVTACTNSAFPCLTFSYALAAAHFPKGATLILQNGTYTRSNSGDGKDIINLDCTPTNGTSFSGDPGLPNTVKAQNERQAWLKQDGTGSVIWTTGCSYWSFEGLRASSADLNVNLNSRFIYITQGSDHVSFKRNLISNTNRYRNESGILAELSDFALMEENEAYVVRRNVFQCASSDNCIFRRNYSHKRGVDDIAGGWVGGGDCVAIYPGNNAIVENNVCEGNAGTGGTAEGAGGSSIAAGYNGVAATNNRFYGNIANSTQLGFNSHARGATNLLTPQNDIYENNVSISASASYGFYHRGAFNITGRNNTAISGTPGGFAWDMPTSEPGFDRSFNETNSLAISGSTYGFFWASQTTHTENYVNAFGNPTPFSPGVDANRTNSTTTNPNLGTCKVWIPAGTPMKGAGLGGNDIGANVLYEYSNGSQTTIPLWNPTTNHFVGCGVIVPGVNDIAGSSCINVDTRLNVNQGGCLFPVGYASSGIPPGVGWYDIPNTKLRSVCPPNNFGGTTYAYAANCQYVTNAWNSGVYDSLRNRLVIWGGGHANYWGNEIYALNLNTLTLTRLNNPGLPPPNDPSYGSLPTHVEALTDGSAGPRHTYDGIAYVANIDKMYAFSGSLSTDGNNGNTTWLFNFATMLWENKGNAQANRPNGGYGTVAKYDPARQLVFVHDITNLYSYNPATNVYTKLTNNSSNVDIHIAGTIDTTRHRFIVMGGGQLFWYDISAGSSYVKNTGNQTGGTAITNTGYPGIAYNPVVDRVVGWPGGTSVYLYNTATDSWTNQTYNNIPAPAITTCDGQCNGATGRWQYVPSMDLFVTYNLVDNDGYTLRLNPPVADTTPPTTPTSLTATAVSSTQINLSWTASTDNVGVAGYNVYRPFPTIIAVAGTNSLSDTGLTPSTSYTYTVAAFDGSSNLSGQSNTASAVTPAASDTTPPSIPTGLTATAVSTSQINLSWTASTDNVGVTGYNVYRGGTQIGSSSGTTFQNTGLAASTSYSYTVAAFDAASNTSAQSSSASATTQGGGGGSVVAQYNFTIPGGVVVSGYTNDTGAAYTAGAGFGWVSSTTPNARQRGVNANPLLDSFIFTTVTDTWKKDIANGNYLISLANGDPSNGQGPQRVVIEGVVVVNNQTTTANTFVTTIDFPITVADGQLTVVIGGGGGGGNTCLNYIVIKSATSGDTTAPTTPTNLVATAISSTQINLAWTASTDNVAVTGYNIYRGGSLVTTSATNSFSDSGLLASTAYSYNVAAFDAAANISAQSSAASATTQAGSSGSSSTFQLTAPTTGTLPFTVGLVFKKGDIPNYPILNIAEYQTAVKRRWNDGSVKHAIMSGQTALTANVAKTITFSNSTSAPGGTPLTSANIATASPTASVQLGTIGTVNLGTLLASPFRTWISGPEMVECHYRSSVGTDTSLNVWFHVRLYKAGRMWVRAIVENGYVGVSVDKVYIPTIIIGGTTVYSNGGASLTHYANTRYMAEGWIGGDPAVLPKHNSQYLTDTKLFPNYWKRNPSATALNNLLQVYTPMDKGPQTAAMGSAGYQPAIGLLPLWDALYVTSTDPRAFKACLVGSSSMNSFPIVWRSQATQLEVKPSENPAGLSAYGWSAGPLHWEYNHHPSAGYTAYLLTGDYWHYETMLMNSAMAFVLLNNIGRGAGVNAILSAETRGTAWGLRSLSQFAGAAPDGDALVAEYQSLLINNMIHWQQAKATIPAPGVGEVYEYGFPYGPGLTAPWMQHFFDQSVGMGSDVEPLSDMTVYNNVRDYLYQYPVGHLGDSTGYYFTYASGYNIKISPQTSDANPALNYTTWPQVFAADQSVGLVPTPPLFDNTLKGGSGGGVNEAFDGYWGNLIPAIAYAVDHAAPGAAAAWTRLTGASNWSAIMANPFDDIPIWGIIPRGTVTPPPNLPPPPTNIRRVP